MLGELEECNDDLSSICYLDLLLTELTWRLDTRKLECDQMEINKQQERWAREAGKVSHQFSEHAEHWKGIVVCNSRLPALFHTKNIQQ